MGKILNIIDTSGSGLSLCTKITTTVHCYAIYNVPLAIIVESIEVYSFFFLRSIYLFSFHFFFLLSIHQRVQYTF